MHSSLSRNTKITRFLDNIPSAFIASQSKISVVLSLFFVVLSAWITGQLVWQVIDNKVAMVGWLAKPTVASVASTTGSNDVSAIHKANIFGQYSETVVEVVKPVVQDAPKTRLNLVLVGAVSSSEVTNSLAVIANKGKQATYGVGELIDGTQAKLKVVFVDRVIIENAGRDETLMLEGVEYKRRSLSDKEPTSNTSIRNDNNKPSLGVDQLANIRQQILDDPQRILRYIRLSQMKKDGQLIGYRVRPGTQRALFDSVGLKDGDIAIRLNGEDLTNPASMGKIWQSINELTELNLTVERNGQSHDIYIAF